MKSICKIFVLSGILMAYANVAVAADSTPSIADSGLATTNYVKGALTTELAKKQDKLVSGTNIKTINSTSILGSGNIAVQPTISGAATTITSSNLAANRAVISNANGKVAVSDTTSTELGYVHGVTSAIQTQLNDKQATLTVGDSGNIKGSDGVSVSKSDDTITVSGVAASTSAPGVVQLVEQINDTNKTDKTMAVTPNAVNLQMENAVAAAANAQSTANGKQAKSTENYQVGAANGTWQPIATAITTAQIDGDDVLSVAAGTGTNAGKAVVSVERGTPTQLGVVRVGEIPSGSETATTYATIWVQ